MQTINLTCGHCGNVMAVSPDWLGQQVRCPHCAHVVQTAAPPAPGKEEGIGLFHLPSRAEQESIFNPPEEVGDEALGGSPRHVAAPDDADWPDPPRDVSPVPAPYLEPRLLPEEPAPTEFAAPPAPSGEGMTVAFLKPPAASAEPEARADDLLPTMPSPAARAAARSRGSGLLLALVIVPLMSYSVLATIAVIVLRTQPEKPHPLEMLPDLEGDNPGATHQKKGQSQRYRVPPPDTTDVPPHLRLELGQTLTLGDLEVTPESVGRRRITIRVGNREPDPVEKECLALELRFRNRSADVVFAPMDRYFTRRWKSGGGLMPFTSLEVGADRFYGGPTPWKPRGGGRFTDPAEVVVGQNFDRELKPGEEMTTFVCTDPEDDVLRAVAAYSGRLLWRVQVRRGLVRWTTSRGVEREDPATAVVGVEFGAADAAALRRSGGARGGAPSWCSGGALRDPRLWDITPSGQGFQHGCKPKVSKALRQQIM